MRSMLLTSPIVRVSVGALVAVVGLGACQPSHSARPEAAPEPAPTPIAAAHAVTGPEVAPPPTQIALEVGAQAGAAAATPQAPPVEKAAAPTSASPAVKADVAAQQSSAPTAVKAVIQPGVLPAGTGRNVAQRLCGTCHSLVLVTAAGHTEAEWDSIVARMEANGMQASADDIDTVITYLAKALPPR